MLPAPVEIASPAPAAKVIVPVEDAKPVAETAFSPLIEILMAPAAVTVCKLMLFPATSARLIAVPVILVPEAEIVWVP